MEEKYLLTDGSLFIQIGENGVVNRVNDPTAATVFSADDALFLLERVPKKTKNYYMNETDSATEIFKLNRKIYPAHKQKKANSKKKRKIYPKIDRLAVYTKANGYCQLCGGAVTFNDMTLDHIVPLDLGGADDISNLQCACDACNKFKDNIKPEIFEEKIRSIFKYQMQKKFAFSWKWKLAKMLLAGLN